MKRRHVTTPCVTSVCWHLLLAAAVVAPTAFSGVAQAGELDPKTGELVFVSTAIRTYSFETAASLASSQLSFVKFNTDGGFEVTPIAATTDVSTYLVKGGIHGNSALRLSSGSTAATTTGLLIDDPALFASVANKRISVSMWGRAEGIAPSISVYYGKPTDPVSTDHAVVRAVRTGRETSDGWVEYSTNVVDGAVWGVPIRAIGAIPSYYAPARQAFLIDAIEINAVAGEPMKPLACTVDNVDEVCGARGDCMYGHCVDSTVTWGALPPREHRVELAERWITLGGRLISNRSSANFGLKTMAPAVRDVARYSLSSRQFFSGLNRGVNGLRDNHTGFGSPPSAFAFQPVVSFPWSGALHACFGVMEKDLLGGGQGFGVFSAGDKAITGVVLKPGDVLTAIDGQDPKVWVDAHWLDWMTAMPNDPKSDLSQMAEDLSAMITARANTITLTRCTSSTKCAGADRQEIKIDVAKATYGTFEKDTGISDWFYCGNRFRSAVDKSDPRDPEGDTVTVRTADSIVTVQFNGFSGGDTWKQKWTDAFSTRPAKMLVDARTGNGGSDDNINHLFSLMRGKSDPLVVASLGRTGWDEPDLFEPVKTWQACFARGSFSVGCFGASFDETTADDPPGGKSKIAWINTRDVSANDYMPRMIQGRANFKMFAPTPTSGAFGAVMELPTYLSGWQGSRMPYFDTRFAKDVASLPSTRWESGIGVPPDVVVTQKMSDAMDGKDTLLLAARAWLAGETP